MAERGPFGDSIRGCGDSRDRDLVAEWLDQALTKLDHYLRLISHRLIRMGTMAMQCRG